MPDDVQSGVPLDGDPGPEVVSQQNVGRDDMEGSGEWPHPGAPARGPAPGTAEPLAADIEPPVGFKPPAGFKEMLDADPVAGGSRAEPD